MDRKDWLAAGALAAAVAALVATAGLWPLAWAEGETAVAIPELPPAELKIPAMDATVKATAERSPGKAVYVDLACEGNSAHAGQEVPIVIEVCKMEGPDRMSRSGIPREIQVARVEKRLTLDSGGSAQATLVFPLTWTPDKPAAPEEEPKEAAFDGDYYLKITSPLAPQPKVIRMARRKAEASK
jgi:hypothetical protein